MDVMPIVPRISARLIGTVAALALVATAAPAAHAQSVDGSATDLPVLSREVVRGSSQIRGNEAVAPTVKSIDGDAGDWVGTPTRYGGTAVYSSGELVYQDHLFDAHGPDDGRDASRLEKTDPLAEAAPETYRLDALAQADPVGELGIPTPEEYSYDDTYGDAAPHQDAADLHEVRVALDGGSLALLARTTTMTAASRTALLVLADTAPGEEPREIPFNSGISSSSAEFAIFLSAAGGSVTDLAAGTTAALPAGAIAVDPSGYANAIEAAIPLDAIGSPPTLRLAVASGTASESGDGFAHLNIETANDTPHANLANVAFRFDEPVRVWFERKQALALHFGSIDEFFVEVDASKLASGVNETYEPGPGYHDRIFVSSDRVATESGRNGLLQHYGLYLPESFDAAAASPLQWWLHWRGGNAHTAAGVAPRIFKHFGDDSDTIVVSPSGRGTGRWYVGKGHVDFLEVWADVFDTFTIDRDRVYVTGHSMGGWGSYLLTLLYPDRFAAAAPYAGPVTQGAWTGADFQGCDEFQYDDYTPCYIAANGSNPRDQHTRKLLENARHVPYAIMHGTSDELVPYSGVARQAERLFQLGYRFRFYTYPGYEHYSHPVMDQWTEAARYMHGFTRDNNPARVTFKRDMPFEIATERVQSDGLALDFEFDSAYWLSELTAVDGERGSALFDGRSLAIAEEPHLVAPDTGAPTGPGTTGPYVITGQQWLDDPTSFAPPLENGFEATLTGASIARLDLTRMNIDTSESSFGRVTTDGAAIVRLDGGWATAPTVTIDGQETAIAFDAGVATVPVPQGSSLLVVTPGQVVEQGPPLIGFTDASATSGQYSDDATVQALLVDDNGRPLADAPVTFELGSNSVPTTTNESGVATAVLPLTDAPGTYAVSVSYADETGSTNDAADFTIEREDTALSLGSEGKGSKTTWVATLTDADSGAGIAGRTIEFFADGTSVGTATTDDNGTASLSPPPRYRNASTREAVFDGDDYYLSSQS